MTARWPTVADVTVLSLDQSGAERIVPLAGAVAGSLVQGTPVRQFRMHKGQPHWSGQWWCATTCDLETYESRLELARLVLADHDPLVVDLLSQPFTLRTKIGPKVRRHIPDFLLLRDDGHGTVVDVKPAHRVDDPKIAFTFDWTRRVVEAHGWDYEVWTGAPDTLLLNTRFLAAYRDERRVHPDAAQAVAATAVAGLTVGRAIDLAEALGVHRALVKPAVLHLLWTGAFTADLHRPLSNATLLLPGRAL